MLEHLMLELDQTIARSGTKGLRRYILRQEAMAKMLFNADASDGIVNILLSSVMEQHTGLLNEMQETAELVQDADIENLSRRLAANSWATILLCMKGFVALHDPKREYLRSGINTMGFQLSESAIVLCGDYVD